MAAKNTKTDTQYGFEILWAETESYIGKLHYINPGKIIGLRYNKEKSQTIYVVTGGLRVWDSTSINHFVDIEPGNSYHVDPKKLYRYSTPEDQQYPTVLMEVGTNILDDLIIIENISG